MGPDAVARVQRPGRQQRTHRRGRGLHATPVHAERTRPERREPQRLLGHGRVPRSPRGRAHNGPADRPGGRRRGGGACRRRQRRLPAREIRQSAGSTRRDTRVRRRHLRRRRRVATRLLRTGPGQDRRLAAPGTGGNGRPGRPLAQLRKRLLSHAAGPAAAWSDPPGRRCRGDRSGPSGTRRLAFRGFTGPRGDRGAGLHPEDPRSRLAARRDSPFTGRRRRHAARTAHCDRQHVQPPVGAGGGAPPRTGSALRARRRQMGSRTPPGDRESRARRGLRRRGAGRRRPLRAASCASRCCRDIRGPWTR